ncbi:MAG TPA: hypothetical protein GX700_07365 [Paracoccus sp.]|nr:hypothetical protein [Paracoccus sp. (in: a-proteobacteria)]
MTRIYERDTDALFARVLGTDPTFQSLFLSLIGGSSRIDEIRRQTRHYGAGHRGSIDLELHGKDGSILLVENKIDAGYSVTLAGDPQPERYEASVAALRARGINAASALLAPEIYLRGSRHAHRFDHRISYEALRACLAGADLALLDAAILQAVTPYDPVPNTSSAAFFADYAAFAGQHFPGLVVKHNPNGNGVRPTGSNTIYFDVPRTLRTWPKLPRPRMSLQCRDSGAPSASVKIMLGGWGMRAIPVPPRLFAIGGYIRPAGRSLGLVIDTPQLDTQMPLDAQVGEVEEGLEAADRLVRWWNADAETLQK